MKTYNYPNHAFGRKKEWLRDVRKRWVEFRKKHINQENSVRSGCVYYPDEVYRWLNQFDKMDELMKDYYKNA